MTDKIQKSLAKLTTREKQLVKVILEKILAGETKGLNIVKLKGSQDIFRAKKGTICIIFRRGPKSDINVLAIERRSEKTYKSY
jgi:mRNA-degrading endonuclease RelE of RelBE toxin-antitoxin system